MHSTAKEKSRDIPWECSGCDKLLGMVDRETRSVLTIKSGKAFYWVQDAPVIGAICPRCGRRNSITKDNKN